jgi:L-gulono-1,4-lactone dehydrogenase
MSAWRNWAGDGTCSPAAHERPGSVEEIAAALERAAAAGRRVRVAGAGHSFGDLACTDGTLLSLERMDRVLELDRTTGLVRVEAGISLGALSAQLDALGLALENLGDIDVQSIAGAIATATHGTGVRLGNIPSQVESVELVLADRTTVTADGRDPELLRAARVGLGSLGVVSAVTLRTVPAFTLRGVDAPRPLEEVLERLDEHAAANDHFELYTFPHSPVALTRTNTRTDSAPDPPSATRRWLEDVLFTNHLFGLFCRAGRRAPRAIPAINRLVSRLPAERVRVDRSHRVFASPRLVRFVEMEYALPRAATAEAVRAVRGLVRDRRLAVGFPLEVRFVAPDDAYLSPAGGRETGYVAVHVFEGMPYEDYFRGVEEIMDGLGGRPHWGKRHFQTAATLRPRYPDWDRFQAVRARLDPDGRFANTYTDRVLGPVGAAVTAA